MKNDGSEYQVVLFTAEVRWESHVRKVEPTTRIQSSSSPMSCFDCQFLVKLEGEKGQFYPLDENNLYPIFFLDLFRDNFSSRKTSHIVDGDIGSFVCELERNNLPKSSTKG